MAKDMDLRRGVELPLMAAMPAGGIREAHATLGRDGYYVVRNLPVDALDEAQYGPFLLELVRQIALPIPQNGAGDVVTRVEDRGGNYQDPKVRGSQTNAALAFHTDRTDLIFLLYIRKAKNGGGLKLADSRKLAASMRQHHPALFAQLLADFPNDAKREQGGTRDWFMAPIFFGVEPELHCRYIRRFIEESQRFADAPRLSVEQLAALDAFDAELARQDNHVTLSVNPGDLVVIDNHRCLHARDAYEDQSDSGRLAIRVWAAHRDSPALPQSLAALYYDVNPGTVRGGFTHMHRAFQIGTPVAIGAA